MRRFHLCRLVICCSLVAGTCEPATSAFADEDADANAQPDVRRIEGDWVVKDRQTLHDQHIVLNGDLILEQEGVLELDRCTLEIIGKRSREHLIDWRGGRLVTRDTTIGGALHEGRAIHTVFHIYDGRWDAVDTIVQYAYGISFNPDNLGILRAKRLKAGARPDAIILSGRADVVLEQCEFPIALGIYTNAGGSATLDLPVGTPVTRTFDKSNIPGAEYRLELVNHTVARQWFVFLRRISMNAPPCEIVLRDCPMVLPSLLSWNIRGELTLTKTLDEPIRIGNVTLRRGDKPVGISMWSIYGGGPEYDLTIRGKETRIAEFMHRAGKVRLIGEPGKSRFNIGCTTLEMSGNAQLELQNVHMGRPLNWSPSKAMGEVNLSDEARISGRNVSINNVVFRTEDAASVHVTDVNKQGAVEVSAEGGSVVLEPARRDQ